MATQQGVIKKFMASLDRTSKKGVAALDEAIKACSPFSNFQAVKKAIINDCKNAKSADDFLKTYCGIDYSTNDNGAITGSDAGGSTSKTDASIIPESGSLKTYKSTSFTKKGLTVKLGDGKTYNDLTASEKFIWNGLYTWWIEGALELIEESYGSNFGFGSNSSATTKNLEVKFVNENNNWFAYSWGTYNMTSGEMNNLVLSINMKYYGGYGEKNIGELNKSFDRLIAHELTHSVVDSNVNYKNVSESLPAFVKEGLAELTIGTEKSNAGQIKALAADYSQFESGLNVNKTKVGVNDSHFPYEGGFIFFRYLARQAGDLTVENKTANKTVLTFYGNDTVTNLASNVTINSGAGNDSVSNWDWGNEYVTVQSGSGNDTIRNVGSNSTLNGGSGNDSIHNWSNQVKIYGDSGNDTVINDNYYSKGDKVTIDAGSGNDYISNFGNSVSIVGGTGNDTIWNGTSSNNVGGSKVTINGGTGNDYIVNWGGVTSIVGGAGNDSIWGCTGSDTLKGDAGNDKLFGNAGNDSLWGGKGNDSLWGGDGKDTFIYAKGDGKDVISGFANDDMLKITGTFSASYNKSKKEIYFKVGSTSNAITLKDFTATSFNVNSTNYKISGTKLVRK